MAREDRREEPVRATRVVAAPVDAELTVQRVPPFRIYLRQRRHQHGEQARSLLGGELCEARYGTVGGRRAGSRTPGGSVGP